MRTVEDIRVLISEMTQAKEELREDGLQEWDEGDIVSNEDEIASINDSLVQLYEDLAMAEVEMMQEELEREVN